MREFSFSGRLRSSGWVLLSLLALTAGAKTTTWTGSGGNWSTTGNWDNGVPVAGDTVVLKSNSSGANIVNDRGAISLAKLSFTGSYPLTLTSSGALTLTGDASGNIIENSIAGDVTVAAPIALGRASDNIVKLTGTALKLALTGVISGNGKLVVSGTFDSSSRPANNVHLSGVNTFKGGLDFSNCRLYAEGNTQSLGAPNTLVRCTANKRSDDTYNGTLYLAVSGTWSYDFQWTLTNQAWLPIMTAAPMTFTGNFLSGNDTVNRIHMLKSSVGGDFYINNGFNMPNQTLYPDFNSQARMHIVNPLNLKSLSSGAYGGGAGYLLLEAPGNYFPDCHIGHSTNIRCMRADVIDHRCGIGFGKYAQAATGVFDMNGFDQQATHIYQNTYTGEPWTYRKVGHRLTSATPATMLLKGATANAETWAKVDGSVSLVWDPAGDYTQVMNGRTNETDGAIIVSNGTFKVAEDCSFANVSELKIAANAKFDLACTNEGALASLGVLEIGEGGKLVATSYARKPYQNTGLNVTLASTASWTVTENLSINRLNVGGVRKEPGKYSSTGASGSVKLTQLAGGGIVTVTESEADTKDATWKVGGVNTRLTDPTNWVEGPQDFDSTGLRATFNVGSGAEVDYYAKLKGMVFGGTSGSFSFTGSKPLAVYQRGIVVGDNRNITFSVPLEVGSSQTWSVGAGGRININGGLSALTGGETITKVGLGSVYLNSESGDIGPWEFGTSSDASAGYVYVNVASNAFGYASDEKTVSFIGQNASQNPKCTQLNILESTVIERPIVMNVANTEYELAVTGGKTVRFTKKYTHCNQHSRCTIAGTAIFEGGYQLPVSGWLILANSGNVYFRKEPVEVNYLYIPSVKVHLETTNNVINSVELLNNGGLLDVAQPYGLNNPNGMFVIRNAGATLLVNGDQDIGYPVICENQPIFAGGTITSTVPSTVHFHLKNGTVTAAGTSRACGSFTNTQVRVAGEVTLYLHGDSTTVFAQNCQATTAGGFGVDAGTLQIMPNASLPNARNFYAEKSGRLEILKADVLNHAATLKVDSSAKVNLAGDQTVSELWVNGQRKRRGTYGSTASGAQFPLSNFEGKGKISVSGMQSMVIGFER